MLRLLLKLLSQQKWLGCVLVLLKLRLMPVLLCLQELHDLGMTLLALSFLRLEEMHESRRKSRFRLLLMMLLLRLLWLLVLLLLTLLRLLRLQMVLLLLRLRLLRLLIGLPLLRLRLLRLLIVLLLLVRLLIVLLLLLRLLIVLLPLLGKITTMWWLLRMNLLSTHPRPLRSPGSTERRSQTRHAGCRPVGRHLLLTLSLAALARTPGWPFCRPGGLRGLR